ncbi:MAG: YjbQ family protein [Candidatus Bipolaricaulota bacterium]|nr:MAG: YjbQ family protein [Candidatus Bipolaricaulota bacterium]
MLEIPLRTTSREELIDLTESLREAVRDGGADSGACLVYCPHTTAGLFVNEGYDPAVGDDIQSFLRRLVPDDGRWTHAEGNAPAHVKATLVGHSVWLPIVAGELCLGRWQAVFFAEFDGPRDRRILLHIGG